MMPDVDEIETGGERRIADLTAAYAPGAWDWDPVSGKFIVNRRLRDILGFQDSDSIGLERLVSVTHPDDRDWADLLNAPAGQFGVQPALIRFRVIKVDTGEMRWIESRIWRHAQMSAGSETPGHSGTVEDVTEQIETSQALTESEERLRLAIEAGKMAVWEVDLENGNMTPSPELNILCGFDPDARPNLQDVRALYNSGELERLNVEGATVEAVRHRAVGGAFEPWSKGAFKSGGDRTQVQAEVAITTPAGIPKRLLLRAQYALSSEGRPRLTGLLVDITEAKMAEERLAVVARELQHRVKNSLSVIRAIAVQSLRGKPDAAAALESFLGRISALAAATDLILEQSSSTAELGSIIEKITRPYRDTMRDPFKLAGPSVLLPPNAATAMGMVFHELCTNAVKYGALSMTGGEVVIRWRQSETGELSLTWEEHNGPPVIPPARRGFGSRLLENILSGEVGGKVQLDFDPHGLRCEIVLPTDASQRLA